MSEATHALILFVVSMAIGLGVYIGTCRYYDEREMGAKIFCVEQRVKYKFCEKYFNQGAAYANQKSTSR